MSFIAPIEKMIKLINSRCDEAWAQPYHGRLSKARREQTLIDAKNYKFRIMVGNIVLLSTGINVPRASCLIDGVTPTSNLPKAKQRFSRILTKVPGKPTPLIIYLLDDGAPVGMRRNEYFNCLTKQFKPTITQENKAIFAKYFQQAAKKRFNLTEW